MQATFSLSGIRRGARAIVPVSLFVIPFGIAFGVAARQAGLADGMILAMSSFVFAGASQFAAIQLWGAEVPLLPLIVITFAVNARHILMGATLYPWMGNLPWRTKLGALALLSDANFGLSMAAHEKGEMDFGHLVGGGIVLWVTWFIGTLTGILFGAGIGDPKALGLDVVMITFFTALLASGWKGRDTALPWAVAGLAAWLAYEYLPANWHVIVGAFAGGMTGVLRGEAKS